MTLAARCPACGTVFRVVQDQLRVSEGWVRCGRCGEVFNAIDTLVEIDAELPPRDPDKDVRPPRVPAESKRPAAAAMPPPRRATAPSPPPSPPSPPPSRLRNAPETTSESTVVAAMSIAAAVAEPASADATPAAPQPFDRARDTPARPAAMPSFVRQADRAARWRRPGVRAALSAATLVLATTLALQVALEYRDHTAARWPVLRPLLQAACAVFGCTIEPPRQIDALAVDASGLVRVEGTAMYKLSVALKNRSDLALAAPALDLTLTDSQGGVLARRVIRLAELGLQRPDVPAATTLPLQATLVGPERAVSGYTIELFYP